MFSELREQAAPAPLAARRRGTPRCRGCWSLRGREATPTVIDTFADCRSSPGREKPLTPRCRGRWSLRGRGAFPAVIDTFDRTAPPAPRCRECWSLRGTAFCRTRLRGTPRAHLGTVALIRARGRGAPLCEEKRCSAKAPLCRDRRCLRTPGQWLQRRAPGRWLQCQADGRGTARGRKCRRERERLSREESRRGLLLHEEGRCKAT